ncbi:MAG: hypothetical protein ACI9FJ_001949 [Alteromonadaceae bacterium]|jgi:hypothetical protein
MLFSSRIALQPKKEVLIEPKPPTKMFAKLFHIMTSERLSPKEKHQTFTAISMLQELNVALRQANITNIIRLVKDGNDFYYDADEVDNDLGDAMRDFNMSTDTFEATLFNDLYLVLEHQVGQLRYLVEIEIKRVHNVNEMPINIHVNGVITSLKTKRGESNKQLTSRLNCQFINKQDYEDFVTRHHSEFDAFTALLEHTFRSVIRCEALKRDDKVQILRPSKAGKSTVTDTQRAPLIYQGYPGWDRYAGYTFFWMGTMTILNVGASDMDIIDDSGQVLQSIGEEHLDAGNEAIFDTRIDVEELKLDTLFATGPGSSNNTSWLDSGGSDGGCGSSGGGGDCDS